ncbi:MAG TPA: hypothetical protein VG817_02950 [Gemmatimonadales bacterium]|nr:hypothetical protein [Gemmatimonadales bacterium]
MNQPMESVTGNVHLLRQAAALLDSIDDSVYAEGGRGADTSPVGVHMRHLIDHYRAFFTGLPEGRIDYDARLRQTPLETDRRLALATILGLVGDIERIDATMGMREVLVSARSAGDSSDPDWSRTTIKRELQFLVSHTVHHFALIKPMLQREGVMLDEHFGYAPSTLAASR